MVHQINHEAPINHDLSLRVRTAGPTHAETEVAVAQFVPLLVLLLVPPLLEPEELQPAVSSRLPATAALPPWRALLTKFPCQTTVPGQRGPRCRSWLDKCR